MPAGPIEDVEFWAAGDLGNMAGRAVRAHPTARRPNDAQRIVTSEQSKPLF
jgi:hypothetical protein